MDVININKSSYDNISQQFHDKFKEELSHKQFDRDALDNFSTLVLKSFSNDHEKILLKVLDVGCSSSAQQASYLSSKFSVTAIDLSEKCIEVAKSHFPDITFHAMDMRTLDFENDSFHGICMFYSLIHITKEEVETVLKECFRVLKKNGVLILTVYLGSHDGIVEAWGKNTFYYRCCAPNEVQQHLERIGMQILSSKERKPFYEGELQLERLYIVARKEG
mmetsp:Transcript_29463/g.41469  ORF Transcript_29463/g.41469 Transcript_29463/m.41469 type:complete len:220 (-) Transcript_29463:290-949(-)